MDKETWHNENPTIIHLGVTRLLKYLSILFLNIITLLQFTESVDNLFTEHEYFAIFTDVHTIKDVHDHIFIYY